MTEGTSNIAAATDASGVPDRPGVIDYEASPDASGKDPNRFAVGTLRYTQLGIVSLFIWLLWGDFCFYLMETVIPNVLPLKLKSLDAPNVVVGILMSTVPSAINFVVNPIVSFRSDRYRSRRGRRIPFLLWATPPLTVFLILLGLAEPLGNALHRNIFGPWFNFSPNTAVLTLIAVFMIGFQICNMFIASVYYYLFNDVVPAAFLSRFMSLFRIVGLCATSLFQFFILPHAQTHMREIFIVAAVLYCIAFLTMCLKVREGEYPPPPEGDVSPGFAASVKIYLTECFTHRFYLQFFISNALWAVGASIAPFILYLNLSIGLDLGTIGKINGASGILSMLLLYPAGIWSDRWHPLRTTLLSVTALVLLAPIPLIWFAVEPTPKLAVMVTVATMLTMLPVRVLYEAASLPVYMRLLPRERYGQFSSADAMVRCVLLIVAGPLVGLCMDGLKWLHNGDPFYHRYAPIFVLICQVSSLMFLWPVYREWKARGGDASFTPPSVG